LIPTQIIVVSSFGGCAASDEVLICQLPSSAICLVSKRAVIVTGMQTADDCPIATEHLLLTAEFSSGFLGG